MEGGPQWLPLQLLPGSRNAQPVAEVEEQILEKGWCPDYREQQRLEASNHSQVENEVARTRCRHLLDGGHGAILWTEILGER